MNEKAKIALHSIDGLMLIQRKDILYALANGNYTRIYLVNDESIKVLKKLKKVTELLSNENFIRIHRSHLINMEHVKRFDKGKIVVMSNDHNLAVARTRKAAFLKRIIKI